MYDHVSVIVKNVDTISDREAAIEDKVNRKSDVVRIPDTSSRITSITATRGTVTTFILAIGGISLIVAAVSIFNVMMMSANERVQEIGILRSIGTEKGEVRRMFLYKASILGVICADVGGICSRVIGYSVVSAMIRQHGVFHLTGQHHVCPVRHDHRHRRLRGLLAVSGVKSIQHGSDRCAAFGIISLISFKWGGRL